MDTNTRKRLLLDLIYQAFDAHVTGHYRIACKRACTLCCTRHVTLTTIEAHSILKDLKQLNLQLDSKCVNTTTGSFFQPQYTINHIAYACLNHQEPPVEEPGPTLDKCPLLKDDLCTVYQNRPFICRAFLSLHPCRLDGQAEVPTGLASVIGACQQLIEHLDVGGYFGNLVDILALQTKMNDSSLIAQGEPIQKTQLPMNRSLPGFLIPPEDRKEVGSFLEMLFNEHVDGMTYYQLLNRIHPLPMNRSQYGVMKA